MRLTAQPFSNGCGPDTLRYTQAKASGNSEYTLSTQSNFLSYGQYYTAPQGITVSGLCFYGRAIGNTSATATITGHLYDFSPQDTLPFGAPLVSGTVEVDTSFHNGNMSQMRYCIIFSEPVTMFNGYIVALETDSTMPIKIYGNNNGDGGFEKLSVTKYGWPWVNMLSFAADVDFHIEPIVTYDLSAQISFEFDSACADRNYTLAAAAPGVTYDRMYNQRAFNNQVLQCFNFTAQGNILPHTLDTFIYVGATGNIPISFTDSIIGWTMQCNVTAYDTLYAINPPQADFSTIGSGLPVEFTSTSVEGQDEYWDFGDGDTGTGNVISHTFTTAGSYTVTLVVTNGCGSDTISSVVTVPFVGVDELLANAPNINLYPNPASDRVVISADTEINVVDVYNINGALINSFNGNKNKLAELALTGYSPGLYFVRISNTKGYTNTTKLIVN
ncbi:MAG: PKD domain-containing protein [Sphingobacteriales bacterium JAD_PAG50586_3]|nr:MAG: PKD domain-containing protein [Sphingobacteriales bacterium JAD_PAG50586_3]